MQEALELSGAVVVSDMSPENRLFPTRTFTFDLSPSVSCDVTIDARHGGFTVQDIKRLIAMLELQRSFLCDEPLDVTVNVSTPRAQDVVQPEKNAVNVANLHEVLAAKSTQ